MAGWGAGGKAGRQGPGPSERATHAGTRGHPRATPGGKKELSPGLLLITEQNKYKYFENKTASKRSTKGPGREAERKETKGAGRRGLPAAVRVRSGAQPRSTYVQADARKDFDPVQLPGSRRSEQRSWSSVGMATRKVRRPGARRPRRGTGLCPAIAEKACGGRPGRRR